MEKYAEKIQRTLELMQEGTNPVMRQECSDGVLEFHLETSKSDEELVANILRQQIMQPISYVMTAAGVITCWLLENGEYTKLCRVVKN